jgi:choline dehydrogenase-like flavoprotein
VPLKPFEAIVIGSGATGGVAAQTLAEAGVRVLVVETGPELSAEEALGSEPVNSMRRIRGLLSGQHRQQAQHPGYWKHNPLLYADERRYPYSTPKDQPFLWTQGRQVGGRSLTWGGITLRLSDLEFKAAERDGYGYSWPICHQDLDPHYSALEQQFAVHGNRDGLTQLPDGCTTAPLSFTPEEQQLAADLQSSADIQMIHSRGFSVHQPSAKCPWPPSSSPGSSLKTALATGRVQVLSGHLAERLLRTH